MNMSSRSRGVAPFPNDIYADLFIANDLVHDHALLSREILSKRPRDWAQDLPSRRRRARRLTVHARERHRERQAARHHRASRARARLSLAIARRASRRRGRRARKMSSRGARDRASRASLGRAGDTAVGDDAWEIVRHRSRDDRHGERRRARVCGDERARHPSTSTRARAPLGMIRLV